MSLFVYDNDTFVVQSFLDEEVTIHVLSDEKTALITDIDRGETIEGELRKAFAFGNRTYDDDVMVFEVKIKPHSFRGFRF
mgnify:FL=1